MHFKKNAETIEAKQWNGSVSRATDIITWLLLNGGNARYNDDPKQISVDVPGGSVLCVPGDYVARRENGEFFVQDSSLAETWEKVEVFVVEVTLPGYLIDRLRQAVKDDTRVQEADTESAIAARKILDWIDENA